MKHGQDTPITANAKERAIAAARATALAAERERVMTIIKLDPKSRISPALASAIAAGTSPGDFAIAKVKAGAVAPRQLNRGEALVERAKSFQPGSAATGHIRAQ